MKEKEKGGREGTLGSLTSNSMISISEPCVWTKSLGLPPRQLLVLDHCRVPGEALKRLTGHTAGTPDSLMS